MKKYLNASITYALLAMAGGVFYREFTKFMAFTGTTSLGFVHVHYLSLGVLFMLLLLALVKLFGEDRLNLTREFMAFNVGLNLTAIMLVVRGVLQVLGTPLAAGVTAAISGVAGIGHILLGVSLVWILLSLKKAVRA